MKKIFSLMLLLLGMSAATMAQTSVLFEDFNSSKLPSGWNAGKYWSFADGEAQAFVIGAPENAVDTLVSPLVDVVKLVNHPTVTVAYQLVEQGGVKDALTLLYRTSTAEAWKVLVELPAQAGMTEVMTPLPAEVNSKVQVAIAAKYNMAMYFPRVEYVIVENRTEAGAAPTGLETSELTAMSVNLNWDVCLSDMFVGYNLKVSTEPMTDMVMPADVVDLSLRDNAYALTKLNPNKDYYVYVQIDCGDGDLSPWASMDFHTLCAAIAAPYSEDFEKGLTNCYVVETESKKSGVNSEYPYNSTRSMLFSDAKGKNTYFFLPQLNDDVKKYQISFMAAASETGLTYSRSITVGVAEAQNSTDVTELKTVELPAGRKWEHITISLEGYKGTGKFIVLKGGNADKENHIYIDDIKVEKASACPTPMFVSVGKISSTSAEISWTEAGASSEWNLVIATKPYADPFDYDPDATKGEYAGSVTTNPYTATKLLPSTQYYVYVASACAIDGGWTNVVSFTTGKEIKFPFKEDFGKFDPDFYKTAMATPYAVPDGWVGSDRGMKPGTAKTDMPYTTTTSYMPYVTTAKDHTDGAYTAASLFLRGTSGSPTSSTSYGYGSYVIMPALPVSDLSDKMIRMWVFTDGTHTIKVGTAKEQNTDIAVGSQFAGANPNITELNSAEITTLNEWTLVELPLTKWTAANGKFITIWVYPGTATPKVYVDDIEVVNAPSCMGVKGPKANVTGATSIDLTWEENLTATSWKVKVSTTELANPATDVADVLTKTVSAQTYNVTGLNPETTYYLYVTPACGDNWKMVSATTEKSVGGLSIPYYNDFSSYGAGSSSGNATWQPGDMKVGNLGGNTSATYIPFIWSTAWAVNTGLTLPAEIVKPSLRFYGYYATSNKNSYGPYAVLPELTNANVKDVTISFWGHTENTTASNNRKIEIGVINDPSSVTASAITHVATATLDNTKAPQQFFINMKNYTGSGKYIVFYLNDATKTGYFNMDNLEINLTSKPWQVTNVVVNSKTQTSATIGWTENGSATKWNVKVFDHSVADPDAETALKSYTATSKTQVISGLVHSTRYFVYVQSVVGTEKGKWSSVCTFFTDCAISSLPYKEDFNIYDHGSTALNTLSPCYMVDGTYSTSAPYNNNYVKNGQTTTSATTATGPGTTYYYVDHTYGNDPSTNTFYMYAAKDKKSLLMLPEIDGDLSQCVMRFYGAYSSVFSATSSTGGGAVEICLYDEATSTYTHVTDCKLTKAKEWEEFLVYFPEGATGRVAFRIFNTPEWRASIGNTYSSGASFYMYIDDIEIMEIPRCQKIQEVSYSEVSATGAKISWTKAGDETAWDVKVSTTLLDDPSAATADGFDGQLTETKKVLTGLADNTKYYVYVRSVNESKSCVGEWSAPIQFTTFCLPVAFPYEENFEDYLKSQIYPCGIMSGKDGQSFAYVDSLSLSNAPSIDGVSKKYLLIKQVAKDNDNYFSLPLMDFEDIRKVQIKFAGAPQYTGLNKWEVGVMTNPSDPSTFTKIQDCEIEYTSGTRPWGDFYVAFTEYNGDDYGNLGKYIAFHPLNRISDVAEGTESTAQFYVDNIVVEPLETCAAPSLLTATEIGITDVTLSWTSEASDKSYRVRIYPTGNTTDLVAEATFTEKSGKVEGLLGNHTYDAYVRMECGEGDDSKWSKAYTFHTECPAATPLPYFTDFDNQAAGEVAYCWGQIQSSFSNQGGTHDLFAKISATYQKSGKNSLSISYSDGKSAKAVTPVLDVESLKDVLVYFDVYAYDKSKLTIEAVESGSEDAAVFPLMEIEIPAKAWKFYSIDLGKYYTSAQPWKQIRLTSSGSTVYIDNFGATTDKNMYFPVAELKSTKVGDTYLDFSFVEPTDLKQWIVEYGVSGFELGTGTQVYLTSTEFELTGLTPYTTYDIYVKGNTTGATWTGPLTVKTTSKVSQLPYETGFEDSNDGWILINAFNGKDYANQFTIGNAALCGAEGTKALFVNHDGEYKYISKYEDGTIGTSYVWAYMAVEFPLNSTYDISIKAKSVGAINYTGNPSDALYVGLCPAGAEFKGNNYYRADGTSAQTIPTNEANREFKLIDKLMGEPDFKWYSNRIDVKTPGIYYLVFKWYNAAAYQEGAPAAIDSITIEEYRCTEITKVRYTNLTSESASLKWDAGQCQNFEVIVSKYLGSKKPDMMDAEDYIFHKEIKGQEFSIDGLLPNTTYGVYLRTICPSGYTSWVEYDITTKCSGETTPYTENFADTPECWILGTTKATTYKYLDQAMKDAGMTFETWTGISMPANATFILPEFELPLNKLGIKFGAFNNSTSAPGRITLGVVDNNFAPETFEQIAIFSLTQKLGSSNSAGNPYVLEEFEKILNTYKGTGKHLALRSDAATNSALKYVTVYELPSCVAPQQLEITDITTEGAKLHWLYGSETKWEIEINGNDTVVANVVPFTLTGLKPGMEYTVRVRAICSEEDQSEWSMPQTFTTECSLATLPMVENFDGQPRDGWATASCWLNRFSTGNLQAVMNGTASLYQPLKSTAINYVWASNWLVNNFDGAEDINSIVSWDCGSTSTSRYYKWFVSPAVEFDGQAILSFDMRYSTNKGEKPATVGRGAAALVFSEDGGETWTKAEHFDLAEEDGKYHTRTFNVSEYAGKTMRFAFYHEGVNGSASTFLFIDNVRLNCAAEYNYTDNVCEGYDYEGNGFNIPNAEIPAIGETKTYDRFAPGVNGCDSTVYLTLTTLETKRDTTKVTICEGESYEWGGRSFTEATETPYFVRGTHPETGCDVVSYLTVKVQPQATPIKVTETIDYTKLPYLYNEANSLYVPLETLGLYENTIYTDSANCQKTEYAITVVKGLVGRSEEATIAEGCSYQFAGQTLTTACVVKDSIVSTYVDTVVTLTLKVTPAPVEPSKAAICENDVYNFGGEELKASGVYRDTVYAAADHRMTINELTLTVKPTKRTTLTETICEGQTYEVAGKQYAKSGIYTDTVMAVSTGCDSIITLDLTVNAAPVIPVEQAICAGDSYEFAGKQLSAAGIYRDTTYSAEGCMSITELTLTIKRTYSTTLPTVYQTKGDTYTEFFEQEITTTGLYKETLTAANGCDSVVSVNVVFLDVQTGTEEATICPAELPYSWKTLTCEAEGTYEFDTLTVLGTDSVIYLTLNVTQPVYGEVNDNFCQGSSYEWLGESLTAAGIYVDTLVSLATGCDSIVTLNLTMIQAPVIPVEQAICDGDSYEFGGKQLSAAGIYRDTTYSVEGCMSISELKLQVNPIKRASVAETICEGSSYEFAGKKLSVAGTYVDTIASVETGCDSITTLVLTVTPATVTPVAATICAGDSYEFGGKQLSAAGIYRDTTYSVEGCMSISELTLTTYAPIAKTYINQTICEGDSYEFDGKKLEEAGTYEATFAAANGCDSTVVLTLTVQAPSTYAYDWTICEGDSYEFDGKQLTEAGVYTAQTYYESGCKNLTTTLTLAIAKRTAATLDVTICAGSEYELFGHSFNTTGVYTVNGINNEGCDSVVTLNLTVSAAIEQIEIGVLCTGGEYVDVNTGRTYTAPGVYTDSLRTLSGCDSLYTLVLKAAQPTLTNLEESICEGESYEFNGETLTNGGVYNATLDGQFCDSVVVLMLHVLAPDTVVMNEVIYTNELPLTYEGEIVLPVGTKPGVYTDPIVLKNVGDNCGTILVGTVEVKLSEGLDNVYEETLVIRPNYIAVGESVTVDINVMERAGASIDVYDVTGKLVTTVRPDGAAPIVISEFHVAGVYTIKLNTAAGVTRVGRVVVK